MTRQFTDSVAVRERVPLLIGLTGCSGSGKTKSALRLAEGIQRVSQGESFGLDSESNRMLHYADAHKFRHVPFNAPFSPLDYEAGLQHCVKKGASVIIVDSMSHEHIGIGGVLEWHDAELQRLSGGDREKAKRVGMLAWSAPKQARQRLISTVLQLPLAAAIFCFRAKEKLKPVPGKEPIEMGWMALAGEEFVYEMTVNVLLPPNANGVPDWKPAEPGSAQMVKLPEQFRPIFKPGVALCEEHGEAMARWAAGGARIEPAAAPAGEQAGESAEAVLALLTVVNEAIDNDDLIAAGPRIEDARRRGEITDADVATLRTAFAEKRKALRSP